MSLDALLAELPSTVDVGAIREQAEALGPPYDVECWGIPLPVWATRPYDDDPGTAWHILQTDLAVDARRTPLCIYVHVPFCSSKCGFCDCYSFAVRSDVEATMDRYVMTVGRELETWGSQGALGERPVSTVHLGGGTPTYLGPGRLAGLIERCRASFAIDAGTELALESTVGGLTPPIMDAMDELGIRRLHVGVQSLQDGVRTAIGRRDPAREVLTRIELALERGWVVSVDLVCGLPEQTTEGFLADIEALLTLGVDGFSLYELLIYPQNRAWAQAHGLGTRTHLPNYVTFVAGARTLDARGFAKRTFNHWANDRDTDAYFTSPARGEDCLAVGTIADGVIGDYHFRHPRFAGYLRGAAIDGIGLEGGLRRTARENELRPLVTAVLAGRIAPEEAVAIDARSEDRGSIVKDWLQRGLVERDPDGALVLTPSGAWFTGDMVRALAGP